MTVGAVARRAVPAPALWDVNLKIHVDLGSSWPGWGAGGASVRLGWEGTRRLSFWLTALALLGAIAAAGVWLSASVAVGTIAIVVAVTSGYFAGVVTTAQTVGFPVPTDVPVDDLGGEASAASAGVAADQTEDEHVDAGEKAAPKHVADPLAGPDDEPAPPLERDPAGLDVPADLRAADLRGADLHGADLSGVDLRGANLQGADLREANLTGARLGHARR
jgi:hypothetical protein